MTYELFECGDVEAQRGGVIRNAKLAYKVAGTLSPARDNVVVYPTSFATTHDDIAWLVGPGRALDTEKFFVIMPNMLGNGLSSSPSHCSSNGFPDVTLVDSVRLQHRLATEIFGVDRIELAIGFSMGAQQVYHWAALWPNMVKRVAVICGSAKTSPHNFLFLEGLKAALTADPSWNGRKFAGDASVGRRAMARVYAGWGLSSAFYRRELYRDAGYNSLEDFIVLDWEAFLLRCDANDLLAMLNAWQQADISDNTLYKGDLKRALRSIRARTLIMPSLTDMYFSHVDSRREAIEIPNAQFLPIETDWGHRVNNPRQNPEDAHFVEASIKQFLRE